MTKCQFLAKYDYPFNLSILRMSDWYRDLCEKNCPIKKFEFKCCYEIDEGRQILRNATVPCPHCETASGWEEGTEDGIKCIHCGCRIYHDRPLEIRKVR